MRVSVTISEPWELGEATNWHSIPAELIRTEIVNGRPVALLKLDEPIIVATSSWPYVIAAPRHAGDWIAELHLGTSVAVSMTGITAQQAMSEKPCDISGWRGGLACIGEVAPAA